MLRALIVTIAIFTASANTVHAQKSVTVVADEWPPFSGSQLPNGGVSLDVISTVLRRAGYDVRTQILPWARIMDGARKGEHDIIGRLFQDPEIAEFMTYGDPFYETQIRFVQRKGSGHSFTDLESLRPYSIVVGDGFLYEEEFDRSDFLNKIVVTTTLQGVQMVAHGRADLTLDSAEVINHAVRTGDPTAAERIEFLPNVLATHGIHMAVRDDLPGKTELVTAFNRVLREMRADGSLRSLLANHQLD